MRGKKITLSIVRKKIQFDTKNKGKILKSKLTGLKMGREKMVFVVVVERFKRGQSKRRKWDQYRKICPSWSCSSTFLRSEGKRLKLKVSREESEGKGEVQLTGWNRGIAGAWGNSVWSPEVIFMVAAAEGLLGRSVCTPCAHTSFRASTLAAEVRKEELTAQGRDWEGASWKGSRFRTLSLEYELGARRTMPSGSTEVAKVTFYVDRLWSTKVWIHKPSNKSHLMTLCRVFKANVTAFKKIQI